MGLSALDGATMRQNNIYSKNQHVGGRSVCGQLATLLKCQKTKRAPRSFRARVKALGNNLLRLVLVGAVDLNLDTFGSIALGYKTAFRLDHFWGFFNNNLFDAKYILNVGFDRCIPAVFINARNRCQ